VNFEANFCITCKFCSKIWAK